jgi:hypothetical protein
VRPEYGIVCGGRDFPLLIDAMASSGTGFIVSVGLVVSALIGRFRRV